MIRRSLHVLCLAVAPTALLGCARSTLINPGGGGGHREAGPTVERVGPAAEGGTIDQSSGYYCPGNCPSPHSCCGTVCTDLSTDPSNCGSCGIVCPSATSDGCSSPGYCSCGTGAACGTTQTCCSGTCANLQTDPNNCGSCGNVCPGGGSCTSGTCGPALCGGVMCATGQTCCGGSCVDTSSNNMNCGGCGVACSVTGASCMGGQCLCAPGGTPCPAGGTGKDIECCGSDCVDLCSTAAHCSSCSNACLACTSGVCIGGSAPDGGTYDLKCL